MPSLAGTVASLLALYSLSFVYTLLRNYVRARKTGFPRIIVPWEQNNLLWMVTAVPLRPHLQTWLPTRIYERLVLCIYGWEFHERLRPYKQYLAGQMSFMLVTCGNTEFWTSDPEITNEVLKRPKDFQQQPLTDLFMARFGHNVLTSNGDRWARQRKISSVINERISKAVFNESVRQTDGLIDAVYDGVGSDHRSAESNQLFDMIKRVTIHVLSGAGMGDSVPFEASASEKPKAGYRLAYMDAVKALIFNITGPLILPQWFLSNYPSFLPGYQNLKTLSYATQEFPALTRDRLNEERRRTVNRKSGDTKSNIMSQLLAASEGAGESSKGKVLSDDEMTGNLFVFTAAGFDTTANTLAYAIALLARHPAWQEWLLEEVDSILPSTKTVDELDYASIIPKATRTLAFMFEILRLFTPLIHISKYTKTSQTITTSTGTYCLPANTNIYINTVALHLNPAVWRNINLAAGETQSEDDEHQFRPTRWLNPTGNSKAHFQPSKGAYVAWSDGPRVCPGQKMSQVEFTAVILVLLRQNRIEAVSLPGEDRAQTNQRLDGIMKKSISLLTLQMDGVYDGTSANAGLKLRLVKRK